MLGFEKRFLLTNDEYELITKYRYTQGATSVQTNIYYDTDEFKLYQEDITCYIKEKNSIYKSVIEDRRNQWQECHIKPFMWHKQKPDDFFKRMGLICQGHLQIKRSQYTVQHEYSSFDVIIDQNTYLNYIDYEIEIIYDLRFEFLVYQELYEIESLILSKLGQDAILCFRNRIGTMTDKSDRFFKRKIYLLNSSPQ